MGPSMLIMLYLKYDKQDQQGKAAFNERNPHMTQQQYMTGFQISLNAAFPC
jgi:hypothetical protein